MYFYLNIKKTFVILGLGIVFSNITLIYFLGKK